MKEDIKKSIEKILISGSKEDLDKYLSTLKEDEQKDILTDILISSSEILEDSKLNRVKTRPLLFYLINDAEKRGRTENKKVLITYADQRKLGVINNTYGPEVGDKAIQAFTDSLHKGLTGIKKSNYDIVRMGGDEFCIITVGEDDVKHYFDEAKTIANTTTIMAGDKPIREKVDFAYGTSELDYSNGKNLRRIIDDAKSKAYYLNKLTEAEEKAEYTKSILIDKEKENAKKEIIRQYIDDVTMFKSNDAEYYYEIIDRKEDVNVNNNSNNDVNNDVNKKSNRRVKDKTISKEFIMLLNDISESKGYKKEEYINKLKEKDIEFLKENFLMFGEEFIRDGDNNLVKRTSQSLLIDALSNEDMSKKRFKYVELDNLKLVNSARTHEDGDKYIGDFLNIMNESIKESKQENINENESASENNKNDTYILKMSGNVAVVIYDEKNENIFDIMQDKASRYVNPEIGITMDVYMTDMYINDLSLESLEHEYLRAGDAIKDEKERHNFGIQKIIHSKHENEIFYKRETFTLSEVYDVLLEDTNVNENLVNTINDMMDENEFRNNIDLMFEANEISEEEREDMLKLISINSLEKDINESIERTKMSPYKFIEEEISSDDKDLTTYEVLNDEILDDEISLNFDETELLNDNEEDEETELE